MDEFERRAQLAEDRLASLEGLVAKLELEYQSQTPVCNATDDATKKTALPAVNNDEKSSYRILHLIRSVREEQERNRQLQESLDKANYRITILARELRSKE